MKRRLIQGLSISLISILALEAGLALADPLGVRYLQQIDFFAAHMQNAPIRYRPAPGHYDMGEWAIDINAQSKRIVPDSGRGCRVVFFGDSVTFGWGVNDDVVFVNQLARLWPDVQTVNAGIPGYNSQQVRHDIENTAYDLAIYLIIGNDPAGMLSWGQQQPVGAQFAYPGFGAWRGSSATGAYLLYLAHVFELSQTDELNRDGMDMARYAADMEALAGREDVLLFAFQGGVGDWTAEHYPVFLLDQYRTTVSPADAHPDRAGHTQITAQMWPVIESYLPGACP